MKDDTLGRLGLEECEGAEVYGGEIVPWAAKLLLAGATAVAAAIVNNWGAFKESFAEGFSAGNSGDW